MLNGSCLCGAITFAAKGAARDAAACHCTQCRKQSGHHWASVQVLDVDLTIEGTPTWFASSDTAKRGFCAICGSFLFWKGASDPDTGISLGALDGATNLKLERHIFTADKGDYCDITDTVHKKENET
jgi:hypothetical protein|tara:strand:+ start:918 stop:1298 length:381 start_codon:yes stop_codon:yes gene_type:complete